MPGSRYRFPQHLGCDGAGGDEPEVPEKLTADQVKAKLLEVRDAYGDKAPALKIINDLGYNAIPDVKAADYQKVEEICGQIEQLKNQNESFGEEWLELLEEE